MLIQYMIISVNPLSSIALDKNQELNRQCSPTMKEHELTLCTLKSVLRALAKCQFLNTIRG